MANWIEYFLYAPITPRDIILLVSLTVVTVFLLVFLNKLGQEGRFFLRQNLFGGEATFMGLLNTGKLVFKAVKARGRALRGKKDEFMFLPGVIPLTDGNPAHGKISDDNSDIDDIKEFNEVIRQPAVLNKRPFFCGTVQTSIASNAKLPEAIASAEENGYEEVKTFLDRLKEVFDTGISNVHLIQPWRIDQLSEYVNVTYSEKDSKEIYQDGLIEGQHSRLQENKWLYMIIIASIVCNLVVIFLLK